MARTGLKAKRQAKTGQMSLCPHDNLKKINMGFLGLAQALSLIRS
jgi:hypothetical protein